MTTERTITPTGVLRDTRSVSDMTKAFTGGGITLMVFRDDRVMAQTLLDRITGDAAATLIMWYEANSDLDLWLMRWHSIEHFRDTDPDFTFGLADRIEDPRHLRTLLAGKVVYGTA